MSHISFFVNSTEDLIISTRDSEIIVGRVSYTDWEDPPEAKGSAYECFHARKDGARESIYDYPFRHGIWTKKIPLPWKNFHRELWGLKPVKEESPLPEWYLDWEDGTVRCPTPENVGDFPAPFVAWVLTNGKQGAKRQHYGGSREQFKTWVFTCPTQVVINELAPMLKGSDFVIKLKCW